MSSKNFSITFVTGNPKKAEQLGYHLDMPVQHRKLDIPEIQSLDLEEVVTRKAREAYKRIGSPVLVEDTSLRFSALGKLPGPLIKWFLTELKNDGLCKLLDPYADRSALAEVKFALFDGETMHVFSGEMPGTIAEQPLGEDGFGWDPIFMPKGYTKTWGQMDAEEQKETSMRRIALKKLEEYLKNATPPVARSVQAHQIVDLLRVAAEELAYSRFISEYPSTSGFRHFDNVAKIDAFYKTVCNSCFHDALLTIASLLDKDKRVISFWNWRPFIESKGIEFEDIVNRFQNSPLQTVRDQVTAHADIANHNNNFPSSKRRGIVDTRLIELLQGYLDEVSALFHLFTRETGNPYVATLFDTSDAEEEVKSVIDLARPQLTREHMI